MKSILTLILTFLGWINLTNLPVERQVKGSFEPVAVLELFTSQGCSSCPAADALLNKIIKENHSQKVFGLSFHVNYWDYLGWQDPYGSKKFTERQERYSTILGSGIYTPQIVVNGSHEFVGSKANEAGKNIKIAMETPAKVAIDVNFSAKKLTYQLHGDFANAVLNVAFVQNEVSNFVKKGENQGKTLSHNNVVRGFETQKITADKGEMTISLPENASKIIIFVQNPANGKILGASAMDL